MKRLLAIGFGLVFLSGIGPAQNQVKGAAPERVGLRFRAVDVFVDSDARPLAAYQLIFSTATGDAKVVGIEGGEHPAFQLPPYYDPKAIQRERVILAAFNTSSADKLPKGKTRVATIHLQLTGAKEPQFSARLQAAADPGAQPIPCKIHLEQRKAQ